MTSSKIGIWCAADDRGPEVTPDEVGGRIQQGFSLRDLPDMLTTYGQSEDQSDQRSEGI
jgi:hypothetical protein